MTPLRSIGISRTRKVEVDRTDTQRGHQLGGVQADAADGIGLKSSWILASAQISPIR